MTEPFSPAFTIHTLALRMANAYLIEGEESLTLVDSGPPGQAARILAEVKRLRKPLRLIFLTHAHFDHFGSAAQVRAHTGAPVAIHQADARALAHGQTPIGSARGRGRLSLPFLPLLALFNRRLRTVPDVLLSDGDRLEPYGLPARLLHTPGHTAGSSCLLLDGAPGRPSLAAFAGDLLTAGRTARIQRLYAQDWAQLAKSLTRLQAARPERVYAGHGQHKIDTQALLEMSVED